MKTFSLHAKEDLYVIRLICGHCSCDSNMEQDLTHTHLHIPGFGDFYIHIDLIPSKLCFVSFPLERSTCSPALLPPVLPLCYGHIFSLSLFESEAEF